MDHVIKDSDSPGLAMQSLLTALSASALSNILTLFDNVHNATVQSSASVLAPREVRGLISVTAVVVVLLVTEIAVVVYYLVGTRCSSRGNYWSTVAQVMSEETRDILERAPLLTDDEVRNQLKSQGDVKMKIGSSSRLERA